MQEMQVRSLGWEDCRSRKWLPALVFLPRKSQGQRSLVGYGPWGRNYTTELLNHQHHCMLGPLAFLSLPSLKQQRQGPVWVPGALFWGMILIWIPHRSVLSLEKQHVRYSPCSVLLGKGRPWFVNILQERVAFTHLWHTGLHSQRTRVHCHLDKAPSSSLFLLLSLPLECP